MSVSIALFLIACGPAPAGVEMGVGAEADSGVEQPTPASPDTFGVTEPRALQHLDYLVPSSSESPSSCEAFLALHRRAKALSLIDVAVEAQLCEVEVLDAATFRARVAASRDATSRRALRQLAGQQEELAELAALLALLLNELPPQPVPADAGTPGVARDPSAAPLKLPDPGQAMVLPLTQEVLAFVALAHANEERALTTADPDARTRADAYLAKVYLQSLRILGPYARAPLGPAARELAGRALYYGRRFCQRYVQRRVVGLAALFAQTEHEMLALAVALDESPFSGDSAMTVLGRERARDWLRSENTRARIERQLAARSVDEVPSSNRLLPLSDELGRLIAAGYGDLALDRASRALLRKEPVGVEDVAAHLRSLAAQTADRRLSRRIDQLITAVERKGARRIGASAFEAPTRSAVTIGRDTLVLWLELQAIAHTGGTSDNAWTAQVAGARANTLLAFHPELLATVVERVQSGEIKVSEAEARGFTRTLSATDSRLAPWLRGAALAASRGGESDVAISPQATSDRRVRLFWAQQATLAARDQLARAPSDEESLQIVDEPPPREPR